MAGSWFDGIRRWFQAGPSVSGSFDPAQFERLCLEDPAGAHAALTADQRDLAEELERTFAAYQERLRAVSAQLASMSIQDIRREARALRDAQDGIRRTMRRIETSARSARQLEQELQEWQARSQEDGPPHADHPAVRAEIIRSELATRSFTPQIKVIAPEASPFGFAPPTVLPQIQDEWGSVEETEIATDPNHILQLIRQETREAERWHAIPEPDAEALEQLRHLRMLHAMLKRLDREQGIRRDRLVLAVRTESSYQ